MRSLFLNLVVLGLICYDPVAASNPVLETADSLMAAGFHNAAITEYKRFLFFCDDITLASEQYAKIGRCHAELGEWRESVAVMDRALLFAFGDSLASHRRLDRCVILMAAGRYGDARSDLEHDFKHSPYGEIRRRAGELLLLSLILAHEWPRALEVSRALEPNGSHPAGCLEASLTEAAGADRKSPRTALLLSTFLPGAGQVYSGEWLTGLNAAALDGGMLWITTHNILRADYQGGFLAWYFLLRRYYAGNRYQARRLAVLHNERTDERHENRILDCYMRRAAGLGR